MSRRDGPRTRPSPVYALLLRLYPASFRDRFSEAMAETFQEERAAARRRGRVALVGLWLRTVVRTPLLAFEERFRHRPAPRRGNCQHSCRMS